MAYIYVQQGIPDMMLFLCNFFNVYLFLRERERDRVQAGEGQRERETQI